MPDLNSQIEAAKHKVSFTSFLILSHNVMPLEIETAYKEDAGAIISRMSRSLG